MLKKILIFLKILQTISNEERHKAGLKRLGDGYLEVYRLNPYNPISYAIIIFVIPIIILAFGFIGLFKETRNPFKWS